MPVYLVGFFPNFTLKNACFRHGNNKVNFPRDIVVFINGFNQQFNYDSQKVLWWSLSIDLIMIFSILYSVINCNYLDLFLWRRMSEQKQEDVRSGSTRVGSNLQIIRRYYSIYSNIRVLKFAYRTRTYFRKYSNFRTFEFRT